MLCRLKTAKIKTYASFLLYLNCLFQVIWLFFAKWVTHIHPACACARRSYVIGAGVHLYIYMYVYYQKKFEWHFSGGLTISNTRDRLFVEFID